MAEIEELLAKLKDLDPETYQILTKKIGDSEPLRPEVKMNVKDIVAAHLRSIGADGLCNFECGCGLDDLMPCVDGAISECVPAKRGPVPEEYKDECSEWFVPMEVTR